MIRQSDEIIRVKDESFDHDKHYAGVNQED
jgi:hypothetical protein